MECPALQLQDRAMSGARASVDFVTSDFVAAFVAEVLLFDRASACAALAAASISAFAWSRLFFNPRCAPTKLTSVAGRSRSSSSADAVTVSGVVSAAFRLP